MVPNPNYTDHEPEDDTDIPAYSAEDPNKKPLNLAHSTKLGNETPPPPPPPRKQTNENTNYSGDQGGTEKLINDDYANMSIDNDIHNILSKSLNYTDQANEKKYLKQDFYTDITKQIRQIGEPGVILPLRSELFVSILASLIMIFSNVPSFSNAMLKHEYLVFPSVSNWWNKQQCTAKPNIVQEFQRLIAFLRPESKRAFASQYNLNKAINKILDEDLEDFYEFYEFIMKEMLSHFETTDNSIKDDLESLFTMYVSVSESPNFCIFISEENVALDLYESILNVFRNVNQSNVYLSQLPDILQIVFDEGMDNLNRGFSLDEIFYPQVYTEEHCDIFTNIDEEIFNIKERKYNIQKQLMKLRAFNGKSVNRLLTQSVDYIQSETKSLQEQEKGDPTTDEKHEEEENLGQHQFYMSDKYKAAGQDISLIHSHMMQTIQQLSEEEIMLDERAHFLLASKHNIHLLITEERKAVMEPWILTGAVINAADFYFKNRDGEWIDVKIDANTYTSYTTKTVEFSDVQTAARNYTETDFGEGMILIYVKESVFSNDDYLPLNNCLKSFIEDDNMKLQEQYNILMQNEEKGEFGTVENKDNTDHQTEDSED